MELKRDRLEARLVREEVEAGSVDEASSIFEELVILSSRPHHSSGMSAADWAISQLTLLPVVVHSSHPVQVVAVVQWPPVFEYTSQGVFLLPWERVERSGRGNDLLIDNVDEVIPPDAHGQAQLFDNQTVIDDAVVPPDVVPPIVLTPPVEPQLAPARPTGTPRVLHTPIRSLLRQANRNRYWQKLMQGTPTVDAIRRQRDRRPEAIAKAKAQESTSRVRAALKTTTAADTSSVTDW